jgi:rhamnulokinase
MYFKFNEPDVLERAEKMLMMPDLFGYMLTGEMKEEATIASTSNLLNPYTKDWDFELIEQLGLPKNIFAPITKPGSIYGYLSDEICEELGCDKVPVIAVASHDTASAVMAVPTNVDDAIYLSSGTWSLLGIEIMEPNVSEISRKYNFTHEGGYNRRIRYLKNIMGLWIIQSIKKNLDDKYSFSELSDMARGYGREYDKIDVNDQRLLAPDNMIEAVREVMGVPDAPIARVLAAVYNGLADYYAETIDSLKAITGKAFSALHIIGGGSRDSYLNELTRDRLSIPVYTGPTEATAIGNIVCQMLSDGVFSSLSEARGAIYNSFDVNKV